jgi:general secretion pathway protein D
LEAGLKKFWLISFSAILVIATWVTVLATAYPVKLEVFPDRLQIRAEQMIRFYVDYAQKTVILPEATLIEGASAGSEIKLEVKKDGFALTIPYDFSTTLSPDGHLLTIMRAEASSTIGVNDERVPVFYELSNATPGQVASILSRLYPGLKVEVDDRQRQLIVVMNPADRPVIDEVVRRLDLPRPQVMFEAEVLEVNRKLSQQLGIDYTKLINLNFKFGEGTPPVGSLGVAPFQRSPLSLEIGINLLKTNGIARTLTRPRIAVLDGLEARINATQTQPVKTVGQGGQISISNITTGINLRLLPKVSSQGTIESQINIAVSSPTGTTSEGLPTYSTRETNTTIRVRNAETIVIGGLIESRRSTASTGVPFLMDIPIIGELFKTTFTDESDTDLLIMVTPYVVGDTLAPTSPKPASPSPTPVVPVPANPLPATPPQP